MEIEIVLSKEQEKAIKAGEPITLITSKTETPKTKTRKMTKDEIEFYLWKKNKTEFVQISFGNGAFRSGGFGNFGYDDLSYYRFRTIDENGKVTEFELPEIEVNNDI